MSVSKHPLLGQGLSSKRLNVLVHIEEQGHSHLYTPPLYFIPLVVTDLGPQNSKHKRM